MAYEKPSVDVLGAIAASPNGIAEELRAAHLRIAEMLAQVKTLEVEATRLRSTGRCDGCHKELEVYCAWCADED